MQPLVLGTRGSPLALVQTEEVRQRLIAMHPELAGADAIRVREIRTTGDRVRDRPLADIGGKGLFTKELDEALLDGRIDAAVHSLKDVPTWLPDGIVLAATLPREDPRDVFIARRAGHFADLPRGAVVGTASPRRQAMVRHRYPQLEVVSLRGNVHTRLAKLDAGEVDATILAAAGLNRLDLAGCATAVLDPEDMLPAVCQGAIGITRRADDDRMAAWLTPVDDPATTLRATAERAMLDALGGSCRTPIGGLAELEDGAATLRLRGLVVRPDGGVLHVTERRGPAEDAAALGRDAGRELRGRAGPGFVEGW